MASAAETKKLEEVVELVKVQNSLISVQTKSLDTLNNKEQEKLEALDTLMATINQVKEVQENAIGAMESGLERMNMATEALIKIHLQAMETWASEQKKTV